MCPGGSKRRHAIRRTDYRLTKEMNRRSTLYSEPLPLLWPLVVESEASRQRARDISKWATGPIDMLDRLENGV